MPAPTKASEIDLTPISGKKYLSLEREWREEFIYFALVDRFHDGQARSPVLQSGRSDGINTPDDFFGGKIKGITKFDPVTPGRNLLNTKCKLYQEIAKMADVMRANEPLRFGRMYFRQISGDGEHFGFPFGFDYTLAFARVLYPDEVLVLYNVSGTAPVRTATDGSRFVKVDLAPHELQ